MERVELQATIAEKERGLKVICPTCKNTKTTQVFGFMVMGTGSSRSKRNPSICGLSGKTELL